MNSRKKVIAIIGSGDSDNVDYEFDMAYVANAAVSRLSRSIDVQIIHVLSAGTLAYKEGHEGTYGLDNFLEGNGVAARLQRLASLAGRAPKKAIVIEPHHYFDSGAAMLARFEQLSYTPLETKTLQRYDFNGFLLRLAGISVFWKIILAIGFGGNVLSVARFLSGRGRINHQFKPSTGIAALILAIAENGDNASYRLDGFSFENADTYIKGEKVSVKTRNHMPFDAIVFNELNRKYDVELV